MTVDATELLRPGLLDGLAVAVAAAAEIPLVASGGGVGAAVKAAASELGAAVAAVPLSIEESPEMEELATEASVRTALERLGSLHALVIDGASLFATPPGRDGLIACLALAWNAARATATQAFLPGHAGGRIVLLAPPAGREYAAPAAAGLENLARTLSIEWARHGITAVAVAPGAETSADELATLVCYLLSPAGAYFSGCLMDLRGAAS
jgi:NAD(P)-dependent dehydrogenase (short-subunit alcohol dehydrogenase family)